MKPGEPTRAARSPGWRSRPACAAPGGSPAWESPQKGTHDAERCGPGYQGGKRGEASGAARSPGQAHGHRAEFFSSFFSFSFGHIITMVPRGLKLCEQQGPNVRVPPSRSAKRMLPPGVPRLPADQEERSLRVHRGLIRSLWLELAEWPPAGLSSTGRVVVPPPAGLWPIRHLGFEWQGRQANYGPS